MHVRIIIKIGMGKRRQSENIGKKTEEDMTIYD
jgi:hypothetical protein